MDEITVQPRNSTTIQKNRKDKCSETNKTIMYREHSLNLLTSITCVGIRSQSRSDVLFIGSTEAFNAVPLFLKIKIKEKSAGRCSTECNISCLFIY